MKTKATSSSAVPVTRSTPVTKSAAQSSTGRTFTHEQVSERARQIWEAEGRPWGRDEEIWYRAERELRESPLAATEARRFANPDALLDPDGDPNDDIDQRLDEIATPRSQPSATSL